MTLGICSVLGLGFQNYLLNMFFRREMNTLYSFLIFFCSFIKQTRQRQKTMSYLKLILVNILIYFLGFFKEVKIIQIMSILFLTLKTKKVFLNVYIHKCIILEYKSAASSFLKIKFLRSNHFKIQESSLFLNCSITSYIPLILFPY